MRSQTPIPRGAATPAIAALLVLSLGALGCSKSETAQARSRDAAAKSVSVSPVHKNSVRRSVDVVGTLAAVDQVTISSEADGRVREVLADLGDRVKAGQVLIRLDNEKQQYTFEQQKAAYARALAQYGATDADHLPEIEQTPDVKRATADLDQATQNFDRASELFKRTLIPQQALDDAHSALQARKAQHESARQNAEPPGQHPGVASDHELRRTATPDTDIRALSDGHVEKRPVNLGELVKSQCRSWPSCASIP
jgi:HlyD family secretion protein